MGKTIIIFFCLLISKTFWAQPKSTSIYEYGSPITACETNFENLFNNWGKWVTNSKETTLISYQYVATLHNKKELKDYSKKICNKNILLKSTSGSTRMENNVITKNLFIYIMPHHLAMQSMKPKVGKEKDGLEIKDIQQFFMNQVQIEDKVYKIVLQTKGKTYNHYVVCRPSNNKIVFDMVFMGIKESENQI